MEVRGDVYGLTARKAEGASGLGERLMAVWTGGSAHVHFLAGLYPHCLLSHPHFERVLVLNELLGRLYTCFSGGWRTMMTEG